MVVLNLYGTLVQINKKLTPSPLLGLLQDAEVRLHAFRVRTCCIRCLHAVRTHVKANCVQYGIFVVHKAPAWTRSRQYGEYGMSLGGHQKLREHSSILVLHSFIVRACVGRRPRFFFVGCCTTIVRPPIYHCVQHGSAPASGVIGCAPSCIGSQGIVVSSNDNSPVPHASMRTELHGGLNFVLKYCASFCPSYVPQHARVWSAACIDHVEHAIQRWWVAFEGLLSRMFSQICRSATTFQRSTLSPLGRNLAHQKKMSISRHGICRPRGCEVAARGCKFEP